MRCENMNKGNTKPTQDNNIVPKEESLVDLLRRCPIDEETWAIILDRPNDTPRDILFDDWFGDDHPEEVEEFTDPT